MSGISKEKMQELLAKVRAARGTDKSGVDNLVTQISKAAPHSIDLTSIGILNDAVSNPTHPKHEEATEAAVDAIREIVSSTAKSLEKAQQDKKTGVAAKVTLNPEQELFVQTILSGEDCCLIGAAGTGKTTCTGQAIRACLESDRIGPVGASTKYLSATAPGILVCSYTRKAVNNIRRAVPEELIPHTLTLHKVLEFEPEFYEIEDKVSGNVKTTMQFVPKRNANNPLPSGLGLVIFEESSMIGTDLYNLFKAATPHLPQEIFIGDIQQLPPIFGPAILGFKMALTKIVELKTVYRQALESPIIRLAHAILSGDPYKFDKTVKMRDEVHPELGGAKVVRKYVPALEQYDEESEHGVLKFQIWQKNFAPEKACYAVIQQFIAWHQKGYYDAYKDIILCPFNKSFGTIAINKGILEYFGKQRGATVFEIIAGFNTHYYAVGDRVLYDKEDAIITEIRRNIDYLGKTPQPASINLDRSGSYSKELSPEEVTASANEEAGLSAELLNDDFLNSFITGGDDSDEGRVNVASHTVKIKYSYGGEEVELRSAAEINNLLGGHALTVHKFQGSEERAVFLVLHKSHAVMVQRELLYTAVTRAREKLHIICENDTFFNGVKSQKVKGNTLQEKIETFKGKNSFEEMEAEMQILRFQKQMKEKKRIKEMGAKSDGKLSDKQPEKPTEPAHGIIDWNLVPKFKEEPEPIQELSPIERLRLKLKQGKGG